MEEQTSKPIYPTLTAKQPTNPNKLYATPLVGFIIKVFMLIPVYIVMIALGIAAWVVTVINSFMVLGSGKYWQTAYDLNLGLMRYQIKMMFFFYGLTDKYPGFNLNIDDTFSVDMAMPTSPSRLYAIPLIGILIRGLLLIPYSIFQSVISQAVAIGVMLGAWFVVLTQNRYPESMFEFARDNARLSLSQSAYVAGLSDKYPSFKISWNHKGIKIALVIASAICMVFQFASDMNQPKTSSTNYDYSNYSNFDYNYTP